jgi:cell wall-associated NlpC family hydrolase
MQYRLAGSPGLKRIRARRDLKRADLIFFKTSSGPVGHVGIYVGSGEFVSAIRSGVRVADVSDPYYWSERYVGAVRVNLR